MRLHLEIFFYFLNLIIFKTRKHLFKWHLHTFNGVLISYPSVVPMECAAWTRSESADEELVANVQSLRDQLRRTEKSLQSLGEELSRYKCVWE